MLNSTAPLADTGLPSIKAGKVGKPPVQSVGEAENLDDLAHGQVVLVTARWILVISSLCFVLWHPEAINTLRIQIILILCLAIANFYLHAQVLMKRSVLPQVIYAASICDLIAITSVVAIEDSFHSNTFVFYFPAIMAYSVVFAPRLTAMFTGCASAFYALECVLTGSFWVGQANVQVVFARVLMMVAIAVLSTVFANIEHERREEANASREALISELGKRADAETPADERVIVREAQAERN